MDNKKIVKATMVRIATETHTKAKTVALLYDKTLEEVLNDALNEYVEKNFSKKAVLEYVNKKFAD